MSMRLRQPHRLMALDIIEEFPQSARRSARAGPISLQCSPTDIIFGLASPSSYSTSNVSLR